MLSVVSDFINIMDKSKIVLIIFSKPISKICAKLYELAFQSDLK